MTHAIEGSVWLRALGWLERQREGFALPRGREPELFQLKALGELAAVAEVLWRRDDLPPAVRARIVALLEFAWTELEGGAVLARFLDGRPLPVLGTTYAVFERLGWRDQPTRDRLQRLGQPGALGAARAPVNAVAEPVAAQYGADGVAVLCLGLALAWEVLGLASPWQRAALFPRTRLAQRPSESALSVPDAYSLTHTVFFMTDWGAHPDGLPAPVREYLAGNGRQWMDAFRAQRHFDLYAELAVALRCVDAPGPADEVEAVLRAAQEEDGAVPGPAARVAERTRGIDDPQRRRFVCAYHTTLAAMLASFAATVGLARAAHGAAARTER